MNRSKCGNLFERGILFENGVTATGKLPSAAEMNPRSPRFKKIRKRGAPVSSRSLQRVRHRCDQWIVESGAVPAFSFLNPSASSCRPSAREVASRYAQVFLTSTSARSSVALSALFMLISKCFLAAPISERLYSVKPACSGLGSPKILEGQDRAPRLTSL